MDNIFPESQKLFLRILRAPEATDERKLNGLGHGQLVSGVFSNGPAEIVLIDDHVTDPEVLGLQGGRNPGRTAPNDENVRVPSRAICVAMRVQPVADGPHDLAALLHGVADQSHAAELAGDEDARHRCLQFRREHRYVGP
jgi:hypothetical protein